MKPLSEWTLSETKEWCATHKCSGCMLNDFDGCALMDVPPERWRFPRAKVDNTDTLHVQLDPGAYMPERAHPADAGLDLRSPVNEFVPSFGSAIIDTGVHVEIPEGYVGMLKSKSGLNVKHGLTSEGVIDSGYTGSIVVKLYNHSSKEYLVQKETRLASL